MSICHSPHVQLCRGTRAGSASTMGLHSSPSSSRHRTRRIGWVFGVWMSLGSWCSMRPWVDTCTSHSSGLRSISSAGTYRSRAGGRRVRPKDRPVVCTFYTLRADMGGVKSRV